MNMKTINIKKENFATSVKRTANQLKKQFNNVFEWANCAQDFAFQNDYCSNEYTFAADFAIAEWCGYSAILDTYSRMKQNWFDDETTAKEIGMAILSRIDLFEQDENNDMVNVYKALLITFNTDVKSTKWYKK